MCFSSIDPTCCSSETSIVNLFLFHLLQSINSGRSINGECRSRYCRGHAFKSDLLCRQGIKGQYLQLISEITLMHPLERTLQYVDLSESRYFVDREHESGTTEKSHSQFKQYDFLYHKHSQKIWQKLSSFPSIIILHLYI